MAKQTPALLHETPASASLIAGVARRDITPPVGIYSRMWGAAKHDVSEGTHKPLSVTSMVFKQDRKSDLFVLISIDMALLGDLGGADDSASVMGPLFKTLKLDRSRVIVNCTHTHGSPWSATSRAHNPGGHMIAPFLAHIGQAILESTREALELAAPATLTWATGKCSLAANRDLPDPDKSKKRVVCGYNPNIVADDTLLVGRLTRDLDNKTIATIVNYACHPTTLAWLNKLISPDFIGSMREVVEAHTGGAPSLFLQGASGELAPAHQYVGDHAVADKHGRQLGFAALSALESMLPPRQRLTYQGVTESGAPLAVWLPEPFEPPSGVETICVDVPLPLREMPTPEQLQRDIDACTDRTLRERMFRKLQIVKALDSSTQHAMPAWVWRIGQTLIIAHPNEAYSVFQKELRATFPDYAVVVMNVSGPELGYLSPPELYSQNIYQVWQTPFSKKALAVLTESCVKAGKTLVNRAKAGKKSGAKRKAAAKA
ncbi:MAG: neutral/alkaline non-lysosomal ceramidase N-terminal domain-containing protein [Planctomycetota bacterium]|nr:neutral/alkaline non-lysosomal ceramidase N-terminal domain-containing protein [Planctomycetota bacterium]